jgi:hypothetical protein
MNKALLALILTFTLITAVGLTQLKKEQIKELSQSQLAEQEALYLPNGNALKLLSAGYHNALANYFWFSTINYFGKHYRSDRSYKWLAHRCGLIQELDPIYAQVPEFCALILAFEAKDATAARAVLTRGIQANPDNWRLHYLLGMNHLMFTKDAVKARNAFITGAKKPNAEPFLVRLAAKQSFTLNEPELALQFLEDAIKNANSGEQKQALFKHYQKTFQEIRVKQLEDLRAQYETSQGRPLQKLPELLSLGINSKMLVDPFGGSYYLDEQSGNIKYKPKNIDSK